MGIFVYENKLKKSLKIFFYSKSMPYIYIIKQINTIKMAMHKEHLTLTKLYLNKNNVISGVKIGGITCGTKQQNGNIPHMIMSEDLSMFLKLIKIDKNQVCQKCLNILKTQYSELKATQATR